MIGALWKDPVFLGSGASALIGGLCLALSGPSPARVLPASVSAARATPSPLPSLLPMPRTRGTWTVDPQGGGDARTIAEIAPRFANGDLVLLSPGTHVLSLDSDLDLTIRGVGQGAIVTGDPGWLRVRAGHLRLEKVSLRASRSGMGIEVDRGALTLRAVSVELKFPDSIRVRDGGRLDLHDVVFTAYGKLDIEDSTARISESAFRETELVFGGKSEAQMRDTVCGRTRSIGVSEEARIELNRVEIQALEREMIVADAATMALNRVKFVDPGVKPLVYAADRSTVRWHGMELPGAAEVWVRRFGKAKLEVDGEEVRDTVTVAASSARAPAAFEKSPEPPHREPEPKKEPFVQSPPPPMPTPLAGSVDGVEPVRSAFADQIDFKGPKRAPAAVEFPY